MQDSGTPIILYGRLYTKYETVIREVDTFADEKPNSVFSKGGEVIVPASGETAEDISIASVVDQSGVMLGGDLNIITPPQELDSAFLAISISNGKPHNDMSKMAQGKSVVHLHNSDLAKVNLLYPSYEEQRRISQHFKSIDNLITLHQRKLFFIKRRKLYMIDGFNRDNYFADYYEQWIRVYKEGAIRKITLDKYYMSLSWVRRLAPNLQMGDLSRVTYQQLINDYAEMHERQTTMDFHHQLKGSILDAVDEGLIDRDPTRKAIIKGKQPTAKKNKYLNQFQLHTMLVQLNLSPMVNWDWFILLIAKTGMRFSEALALTPNDFCFDRQCLFVNKTWDYKGEGGFLPTKNKSSVRKIQIDWHTVTQFSELIKYLPKDKPIFIQEGKPVYNSTVNDILARHCQKANIPVISVHGLRHTHASILLFAGVSIASVARRLGHSSMTTTQKTYLHIIHELESQDVDLVMRSLSGLS